MRNEEQPPRDPQGGPFTGASAERLAVLREAFEQTADACTASLLDASAAPLRLSFEKIESGTLPDFLDGTASGRVFGIIGIPSWDARALIGTPRDLALAFVELALGADGSEPPCVFERSLSTVEKKVAGVLFEAIVKAMEARFAPASGASFTVESLAEEVDGNVFGRRPERIAITTFRLVAGNRDGEVALVFPQSILNRMRQALMPAKPKEAEKPDALWAQQIQRQVTRANVVLSAVLEERMDLLGDVADFKVGGIIELDATARTRISVECNGERLVWCHLGKSNGVYTLRVDDFVDREQEFMNDILAG